MYCNTQKLEYEENSNNYIWKTRKVKKMEQIFCGAEKHTITDIYTQLGLTFTENENLREAVKILCDKALK